MNEETIRLLLRVTARISGLLFLVAFAGHGLRAVWPSDLARRIEGLRAQFLLAFAGSHTIHLALVITLAMTIGDGFLRELPRHGLAIGGFAYLLIYGLAAAALVDMRTQRAVRIPILHSSAFQGFAAYFIWTVFALVFVGGVFRRPATYTLLAVAVLGALALRLMARRRSSQPVSAVAEASR